MSPHLLQAAMVGIILGSFMAPSAVLWSWLFDRQRFLSWKRHALWPIGKYIISSYQICLTTGFVGLTSGVVYLMSMGVAVPQALFGMAELFGIAATSMAIIWLPVFLIGWLLSWWRHGGAAS